MAVRVVLFASRARACDFDVHLPSRELTRPHIKRQESCRASVRHPFQASGVQSELIGSRFATVSGTGLDGFRQCRLCALHSRERLTLEYLQMTPGASLSVTPGISFLSQRKQDSRNWLRMLDLSERVTQAHP